MALHFVAFSSSTRRYDLDVHFAWTPYVLLSVMLLWCTACLKFWFLMLVSFTSCLLAFLIFIKTLCVHLASCFVFEGTHLICKSTTYLPNGFTSLLVPCRVPNVLDSMPNSADLWILCILTALWRLASAVQGIIQHSTINNLSFGRSVEETVRTLQAVQYVQENPDEVCPAGWKPGDVTMKPDPKGSKEYFAAI